MVILKHMRCDIISRQGSTETDFNPESHIPAMEVPPLVYVILLLIVIIGPVMANIAYNGWKKVLLSRIFLIISAISMITLVIMVLTEM